MLTSSQILRFSTNVFRNMLQNLRSYRLFVIKKVQYNGGEIASRLLMEDDSSPVGQFWSLLVNRLLYLFQLLAAKVRIECQSWFNHRSGRFTALRPSIFFAQHCRMWQKQFVTWGIRWSKTARNHGRPQTPSLNYSKLFVVDLYV